MLQTEAKPQTGTRRLQDQVAFVTGASSGIGRATAIRLAAEGAKVCLADLKESRSEDVKRTIEQAGGQAIITDIDVSDPKRVEEGIRQMVEAFGRLDVVFANAGINGTLAPIEDMTIEDWDHTLTTNLKGTFLAVKYAIPHMKLHGGSIIVTSSINGSRVFSNFGFSAYSTSKAGQVAFAKMAALELARYKIRVNVICPGAIETNIGENTHKTKELEKITIPVQYPEGSQPLEHRAGKPEQVADLVLFLASKESEHISGTEIFIDGVESLL
ncbi:SDR family oxidoreductase [Paenibacillus flagellatus]|uniref:3-oxoacyl-[acyl-carrier-protein] reductase n=1 Tax=Paenibacillus flagellatus TaxID=2211139 RepID=A0A2V5K8F5_9BACL|nr:SDR family NAD(P)-dependent oxidoreductase [Paenibacillus flagellatus]PYI55761.1 3-oxoacyl-[acyl-carrier-protein] reductase [Paenibacillus flagellatus]